MINDVYRFARRSKDATTDYYGKPFQAIYSAGCVGIKRFRFIQDRRPLFCAKSRNERRGIDFNLTVNNSLIIDIFRDKISVREMDWGTTKYGNC